MVEQNWQLVRKQDTLIKRARIIQQIRAFFIERDFLEVETPHRIPANAPELFIDAVASDNWFLQTSPELCMKRLLAAGYPLLFQICRCWREGERSKTHLPEYTMLEWYRSHCDYHQLMDDCEKLLLHLCPDNVLKWQGKSIDLTPPWPRMTVAEAFKLFSPISLETALETDEFDTTIALKIEPRLPQDKPLFLTEYPVKYASLARKKPADPHVAERFELYIGGIEIANAFSELNDPDEQRQRFQLEESQRRAAGKSSYPTPKPFLNELATLPPAAGIALGVDRLIMLLCDKNEIDEVVTFIPEQL